MDIHTDDSGKRKALAALILLTIVAIACYAGRSRIRSFYNEHFLDALPGTWYVFLLVVVIVILVVANRFLRSWRVSSLEVVLLMVLSFGLIGAFVGLVFGYFWQIDEYPLWEHCMVAMTAVGALAALICLLTPERDREGERGYTRVDPTSDPRLYGMMEDLCSRAGCEMPPLYILDIDVCNAYAYGKFGRHKGIVVMRPLLNILDDDELEGILGHELTHILHHDVAVMTMASTCARVLCVFSAVMGVMAMAAGTILASNGSGKTRRRSGSNASGAAAIIYILMFVFLIPIVITGIVLYASVPLAAITMAPGLSRSREYGADEGSALITRKPMALASALMKLDDYCRGHRVSVKPSAVTDRMITDPFLGTKLKLKDRILRTHPSTADRVRRLQALEKRINGRSRYPYIQDGPTTRRRRGARASAVGRSPFQTRPCGWPERVQSRPHHEIRLRNVMGFAPVSFNRISRFVEDPLSCTDTMSILDELTDERTWRTFLERKEAVQHMRPEDLDELRGLIYGDETDPGIYGIARGVVDGTYTFSIPRRALISKGGSRRTREVYLFEEHEAAYLKVMNHLLSRYDCIFSPNLYSYRSTVGAKDAVRRLFRDPRLCRMHGYKTDIHSYFNSIDPVLLLKDLKAILSDDPRLYDLLERLLTRGRFRSDGRVVEGSIGAMPGVPVSPFLANVYLMGLDEHFEGTDIVYMRYSDDIIMLAESEEELAEAVGWMRSYIAGRGLAINPEKDRWFSSGDGFDFLGFSISSERIDLSSSTVRKTKGRIRRQSRSMRRWMIEKDAPVDGSVRAFIRSFDRRFYGSGESGELSWDLWYLPVITTTDSIAVIDHYLQERIRYVATGRYSKRGYEAMPYRRMVELGYRPLVRRYHEMREGAPFRRARLGYHAFALIRLAGTPSYSVISSILIAFTLPLSNRKP